MKRYTKERVGLALLGVVVLAVILAGCVARGSAPVIADRAATETTRTTEPKPVHYCNARTKQNRPCHRRVKNEGDRCPFHQGKEAIPEDYNYKAKGQD